MPQSEGLGFTTLCIFVDNSDGQNKNLNMVLVVLRMVHDKRLFREEFIFLVTGHSYMPCDCAFDNIEKEFAKLMPFMRYLTTALPFEVIPMQWDEFLDIKQLQ